MTSTRRFLARPSFVALSAIGEVSPLPRMVILDGSTPCLTRKSLTVAARCSESFWLYWLVPVLSVCPVICTASTEVTRRTCSAYFSSSGCASFRKVALLTSKNASPPIVTVRDSLVLGAATAAAATGAATTTGASGAAAGAAAATGAGGGARTGSGRGGGGAAIATGAGFCLPQPTMSLSGAHCVVRTQFPKVSMTTRPLDGAPRKASVGS